VLRLSLTENCSSYTNSAYVCNKTSENDDKKTFEADPCKIFSCLISLIGRGLDSTVSIATCYGLEGLGIKFQWGRDILHPSRPVPGAHPASFTMGTESFPGVKQPGHGVNHPPLFSAEVEGRAELYICSPSGPLWPVLG